MSFNKLEIKMANGLGFLISPSVTLTTGTNTILLTGDINCSDVTSGTAIFLDGSNLLVEGVAGSAADPSGNSTITLRETYTGATLTNVSLTAFNTIEGLRDAIQRAREITEANNISDEFSEFLTNATASVDLDINGSIVTTTPYATLVQRVVDLEAITFDGGMY